MLHVHDVIYAYRHQNHVDTYHYALECSPGEVIGILGESGSGKSTLLDLLAGFLIPQSGSILLDGEPIDSLAPEQRPVTVLFQNHNLFEHLTAEQNLLIGLHGNTKGTPQEHEEARAVLSELGSTDQADKVVTQLSGGQQQRVALGRALLRNRPILLLDEPFTGLDPRMHADVLHLVRTLTTQRKLHTLMVTHDPADGDAIADRMYRMVEGRLIQEKHSRQSGR
jgi:thiamine transport system ATP-binding protein